MWVQALWNEGWPLLQWSVVSVGAIVGCATDLAWRRIPNWLTFGLLATGFVHASAWAGVAGALDAFLACILLAAPYVLLFVFAGGGAGDAKLMGAVGAWLGVVNGLVTLVAVALAGVILALAWAVAHRRVGQLAASVAVTVHSNASPTGLGTGLGSLLRVGRALGGSPSALQMPYAPAILLGTVAAGIGVLAWRS